MLQSALIRVARLKSLASLRLTSAALALLAACLVASHLDPTVAREWMVLPLGVLAVNLLAALWWNPRMRRSTGLLVFHVALMIMCVLASAGVLTEFESRVELVEGQSFDAAEVRTVRRGEWSDGPPRALALTQGDIDVRFEQGLVRQHAASRLLLAGGESRVASDVRPLQIDGYRLATSANKGFAVVLAWRDRRGELQMGSVNMPSYPAMEWKQEQTWRTPAGEAVKIALRLPARPTGAWSMRALAPGATVSLHTARGVHAMRPGTSVALPGGTLTLVAVRLWMGYRLDRQPLLPALLACAFLGIGALGWHVVSRQFLTAGQAGACEAGRLGAPRAVRA